MKIHYRDKEKEKIKDGIFRIWLIDDEMGSKNFYLRLFEIFPEKGTDEDKHPYEHGIYVLMGKGLVEVGNELFDVKEGDVIFIPPNEVHSIKNTGDEILRFLCIVPSSSYNKFKKERKNA